MAPVPNLPALLSVWAAAAPAECQQVLSAFVMRRRGEDVAEAHVTTTSLERVTYRTPMMLYAVAAHALDALVAAGYEAQTRGAPDADGDPDRPPSWTVRARVDGGEWAEATAVTLAEAAVAVRVATLVG